MAVNFIARKCACGGKLEFDPGKKIWICKYCGTSVEREATFDRIQVDGIEGISDVVRQTLTDIANNKIESAGRNLEDCERKDHNHVGTLIANISYNLEMISSVKSQEEARKYLDKVKMYAKRFHNEFSTIAEDEINLYEAFGKDSADLYANLLVVFDTLNDSGRIEYISSKLKPEEIFSEHANKALLKISLKRKNYHMAETIVKNTNHIDKKYALQEILLNYPDMGNKTELIELVFDARIVESLSKKFFEQYFENSGDTIETKTFVIRKLVSTNLRCNAEIIVKDLYNQMDSYDTAKNVFLALYTVKVSDQETEAILVFCLMVNKSYDVITAFFDSLLEEKVFMQLNSRILISFLDSTQLNIKERLCVLEKIFQFEIDTKTLDTIYNYYLNNNNDSREDRLKILQFFLKENCPVSAHTVKNYIVHTSIDMDNKLIVIKMIFETNINKTYLGDLLSDYLLSSKDTKDIKDEISEYLIDSGFKANSDFLTQYVVLSEDTVEVKVDKIKKMTANGTQIKADCLDNYILSLRKPSEFSEKMFNLLAEYGFIVNFKAYSKFLLYCRDIDKVRHNKKLLDIVKGELNSQQMNIQHSGNSIVCNLLQAYVLLTEDQYDIADSIISDLSAEKIKINTEILVEDSVMKFKKYVGLKKGSLSPLALQICEKYKMFSFF